MRRRITLAMITIAISACLGLLVVEVALRLLGITAELIYRPNQWYGWSLPASRHFTFDSHGRRIEIDINSQGLRDIPHAYERQPGSLRVLVLGDSFMEALQVAHESTFATQLETELRRRVRDSKLAVEVINAGVSGFGTDNALLFFRQEGRSYRPDVVLLAFYVGNDVRNNSYELELIDSGGQRKPYFTLGREGLELNAYPFTQHEGLPTRVRMFLNRNLRTYGFLRELRDRSRERTTGDRRAMPLDFGLFASPPAPAWESAWRVSEALLVTLAAEISAGGGRLFVMLIPADFQVERALWTRQLEAKGAGSTAVDWDLDAPNRRLRDFLTAQGIPVLDLLPLFRAQVEPGTTLYLPDDGHWTDAGHALAARAAAESLLASGVARSMVTAGNEPATATGR